MLIPFGLFLRLRRNRKPGGLVRFLIDRLHAWQRSLASFFAFVSGFVTSITPALSSGRGFSCLKK